jgi:hypothetical protein
MLGKPILENRMQSNTNISNMKKVNTDLSSIHQSIPSAPSLQPETQNAAACDMIDTMDAIEVYREIIKENIDYTILLERHESERLDEIVELILDAVTSTKRVIRVGGNDCPVEMVKRRLMKLRSGHIEYVLDCLDQNTTKVSNIRNYTLTALFNSTSTIDGYYRAAVNHDLYGD